MQQEPRQRGGVRSSLLTWGLSRPGGEAEREGSPPLPGSCRPTGTPNSHSSRLLSLRLLPDRSKKTDLRRGQGWAPAQGAHPALPGLWPVRASALFPGSLPGQAPAL